MFGFLNINKPEEMTSREAVDCVKQVVKPWSRDLGAKVKLGHAGTLDPLATGVLVIAVGPATRLIGHAQRAKKTYRAQFQLGVESDSLDLETDLREIEDAPNPNREELESALQKFVGEIDQVPPEYSAAKVGGMRAYRLARRGSEFELAARKVTIDSIDLIEYEAPFFSVEIVCGTGTYIRSLGRDVGRELGSGAVMTELQRTSIGAFEIQDAMDPDQLNMEKLQAGLLEPTIAVNHLKRVTLDARQIQAIRNGTLLELPYDDSHPELSACDQLGRLMAVLTRNRHGLWKPSINFSTAYDALPFVTGAEK